MIGTAVTKDKKRRVEKELGLEAASRLEEQDAEEGRSGDSDLEDDDDDDSSSSSDDDQTWTKEVKKEHRNIQVILPL
jgi:hypothetical protein